MACIGYPSVGDRESEKWEFVLELRAGSGVVEERGLAYAAPLFTLLLLVCSL